MTIVPRSKPSPPVQVPLWVPSSWRSTYITLADRYGEEAAAHIVRGRAREGGGIFINGHGWVQEDTRPPGSPLIGVVIG